MNKMNRYVSAMVFLIALLLSLPPTQAFSGYFEPFTTCVQPAFYSSFDLGSQVCNGTLTVNSTPLSDSRIFLTNPIGAVNYTFDIDYSISRSCVDSQGAGGTQCTSGVCDAPGIAITFQTSQGGATTQMLLLSYACSGGSGKFFQVTLNCPTNFYSNSNPGDVSLSHSGHIVINYNTVGQMWNMATDAGGCSGTGTGIAVIALRPGPTNNWNKTRDSVYFDNLVWNDGNGTFNLTTQIPPAEFDTGIKNLAAGLGFISLESQLLFSLILIGLSEIAMAYFTGFFADGKWKVWTIHSVASTVGVICVLLGYLQFWILIIAIVLGGTIVSGGRETLNTFRSLAASVRGNRQPLAASTAQAVVARPGAPPQAESEPAAEAVEQDREAEKEKTQRDNISESNGDNQ